MKREFICTADFDKYWAAMGLRDEDLRGLQSLLVADPKAGDVIPRTGGARKLRIEAKGHGKRGGARVIYVDVTLRNKVYLLLAYPKGQKENLSPEEEKAVARLVKILKDTGGV